MPPTSKVKARGLGAILKHFPSLSLSPPPPPPPSLCSPPVHHRYPCLLPASSVLSRRPVSFRLTRLGFYPLATCLSTRSLLKRRALGIRPPVWNALALMARALGPSEKRNIVLANQPLLSRNSACTSSIFSPASFIFPERSARARHFMSHNYCPPLHSILSYFTPSLALRRALRLDTPSFFRGSSPLPSFQRYLFSRMEQTLPDYFPIVEAIRSFLTL